MGKLTKLIFTGGVASWENGTYSIEIAIEGFSTEKSAQVVALAIKKLVQENMKRLGMTDEPPKGEEGYELQ